MKKIEDLIYKTIFVISVKMTSIVVNTNCYRRYYQDKLDVQTERLKKYYDK